MAAAGGDLDQTWLQKNVYYRRLWRALRRSIAGRGEDQKAITRVHQAYGRNYQLPNTTAYSETCANIGNALWNWRMFLATGEARFMDVVELALYNSVLSGGSLDGTNSFTPIRCG